MRWTIQWKLTAWYAGLLLLVLIVLGVALYQVLGHSLRNEAADSVVARAQQILASVGTPEPTGSPEGEEIDTHYEISDPDLIAEFAAPGFYLEIQDASGNVLTQSAELRGQSLAAGESESAPIDRNGETVRVVDFARLGPMLVTSSPISDSGSTPETLYVARSIQYIDDALTRLRLLLLVLSAGAVILAVAVGAALARQALAPIDRITRTARRIGVEDLHRRLRLAGPDDEVTRLAGAFDEMIDRVEDGFRRERQFSADVAHELRTSLTILKGNIELVLRRTNDEDDSRHEGLETISDETDRMTHVVEDLLLLGRSESGELALDASDVSLPRLCLDVLGAFAPLANQGQIDLGTGRLDDLSVHADGSRLRRLLANLVSNALRYTPSGGRIVLSVREDGPWAILAVEDTGGGIPAEALPHIFERFYRVDRSRSRSEGGTGLGLSISQAIARAHGGRIDVESEVGRGTTFLVRLPLHRSDRD